MYSGRGASFEVNRMAVLGLNDAGGTNQTLSGFCAMLDMPRISDATYSQHSKTLLTDAVDIADQCIPTAAAQTRKLYDTSPDDIIDITISYDCTWSKRGFTSFLGIVFDVCVESGKVLDYHVLSKTCDSRRFLKGCEKSNTESYSAFMQNHGHNCDINHSGISQGKWRYR